MPYTAFYSRKSYIKNNEDIIRRFNNAINKGLEYVRNSTDNEVALAIIDQFPDTSLYDVEKIVKDEEDPENDDIDSILDSKDNKKTSKKLEYDISDEELIDMTINGDK